MYSTDTAFTQQKHDIYSLQTKGQKLASEISQFKQLLKSHPLRFGQLIKLSSLLTSHVPSVEY